MIGKGSAGTVFKAFNTKIGKDVAIKCINIYEKEKRKQLTNDLKSLTQLSIPDKQGILNIPCDFLVNFYGGFLDESTVKIVLEYMDKGSLRDVIKKSVVVSEPVLAMLAVQVGI